MATILMLSAVPGKSYQVASGNTYIADSATGIISNVASVADQQSLTALGCATLNPNPTNQIGKLLAANFNITSDQPIPINNNVRFRITKITVLNTTVNGMSTAQGGVYTGASKGGTVVVASTQAYTGLTNPQTALDLTLANPALVYPAGTLLYLSLTTGQGVAALADLYVQADIFP